MLLFYYQLYAAAQDQFVVLTNHENNLTLKMSISMARLFHLINDVLSTETISNFTNEQKEAFHLPSNITEGIIIPIPDSPETFIFNHEGSIKRYQDLLLSMFKQLSETQKNNDKEGFFSTLEKFLKEGHKEGGEDIAWTVKERIQFFTLFQYLGLQFKDQNFPEIAERIFTFDLSALNKEELELLKESRLNGIHLNIDTINALENWSQNEGPKNPIKLPHITIVLKETLNEEKLKDLSSVFDRFDPHATTFHLTLNNVEALQHGIENQNPDNLQNFPYLILNFEEKLNQTELTILDNLLNAFNLETVTVNIKGDFTETLPLISQMIVGKKN